MRASHPEHGDYFYADLVGRRSAAAQRVNEEAGLGALLRYGFMPHRVAALIYWQVRDGMGWGGVGWGWGGGVRERKKWGLKELKCSCADHVNL